ncbi:MAG: prepilin-type N-terminal cleavage/methylation domain-containing protein [Planctomycetota bacterium]
MFGSSVKGQSHTGSCLSPRGFSLVELIVVIVIVAVLAAVAVPRISGFAGTSRFNATHAGFRNITAAIDMYFTDHAGFPPNEAHSTLPPELQGYLSESAFSNAPPIGRAWDWNGPGSGIYDHGPNLSIHTVPPEDRATMERLFDDGDPDTGSYRTQNDYLVWPVGP